MTLENPNSPARPFSSASTVARLTPAWRESSAWVNLRLLRCSAMRVPTEMRSNTCLVYHSLVVIVSILHCILGSQSLLLPRPWAKVLQGDSNRLIKKAARHEGMG